MGLFGMKGRMEKKIISNGYSKKPSNLPKSVIKDFNVQVAKFSGRMVWTISPKNSESNTVILFLHGGAYYANITSMHWQLIEQLLISIGATIIVPDYPLAPESTCVNTYQFIDKVYASLISAYPSKQVAFMGDSAGGGLALGFAQKIINENIKQPEKIILFSPWLDVSMQNPEILKFDKHDKILSLNGLKIAGRSYAGDLNLTDHRVSPIYGNLSNLCEISIFIGTNDILIADARKFRKQMDEQNINLNYFEYPGLFHDWVIIPSISEAKDVIEKVRNILFPNLLREQA